MSSSLAIRGRWVLAWDKSGQLELLQDHWVHVRGSRIEAVTKDRPAVGVETIEVEESLVVPGFINLHSHVVNGAMFRGVPDDARFEAPWMSRLIYQLLLPMADIALKTLSPAEMRSLVTLGMLDVLKGGTTTLVDNFPAQMEVFFDVAEELGIRAYGAPSGSSAGPTDIGPDGLPRYELHENDISSLDKMVTLVKRYEREGSRVRAMLGPHATDTCAPKFLRAVRAAADDLGCLVTTHLAQTPEEVKLISGRYGKSPVEYLHDVGLLGSDLIAAHCIELSESDLQLLKATDTVVANCTVSFAREGTVAPFWRTAGSGVRTGIGTDSHGMNMVSELRTAGWFSKLFCKRGYVANAYDLVRAATLTGASALRRPDLGRLAPGATADILVFDLAKAHLQPVWDPIKNVIWKGSSADIAATIVDGRVLVRDGKCPHLDERKIMRDAAAAAAKVWALAESRGVLSREIA
jgi:cytosine/adenosine deaminase-related metal-dependent hydrolase